jgi:hypothetical protein
MKSSSNGRNCFGESPPNKILKSDESCIGNPKVEISDWTVQFKVSTFGFPMQDSSDFKILKSGPFCEDLCPYLIEQLLNRRR